MNRLIFLLCGSLVQTLGAQHPVLMVTNPVPALGETFGQAVAAVGDKMVIANPRDFSDAGSVSLYSSNGVLIRTFNNPARANGEFFGQSLAVLGSDRILIGAPLSSPPPLGRPGAAYLFHTNGTLIRTFHRPQPQAFASFGYAVAVVGPDRVLIGAPNDHRATMGGGAAYLFSTNGALLAAITNDAPAVHQAFGASLAAVGADRLLIGAPFGMGTACLMTTNGTLLRRYQDPNGLADSGFGGALAVLGNDRFVITASSANIEAPVSGGANLFDTSGRIVAPLLNPEPEAWDAFGIAVAIVDGDKILVGSSDQRAAPAGGAAYLFSSKGDLLMTINQPVSSFSRLGSTLADLGGGRVLLGAYDLHSVGAAYVYNLAPALQISQPSPAGVSLSWPSAWDGWTLEESFQFGSTSWAEVPESATDDGMDRRVLVAPSGNVRAFRLRRP